MNRFSQGASSKLRPARPAAPGTGRIPISLVIAGLAIVGLVVGHYLPTRSTSPAGAPEPTITQEPTDH